MPTVTPISEQWHDGGYFVNNVMGLYVNDEVTFLAGVKFYPGMIVGKITASGKYKEWNPASADGSQTVAGIVYSYRNATSADKTGVVTARQCEVNASELIWFSGATAPNIATGIAGLKALGIIAR